MMRRLAGGADNSRVEGIYTYPRCPFREVAHAATRRLPVLRRVSGVLWPAARRSEWLRLTDLAPSVPTNRNITFTNAPNPEATRVYRLVVPKLAGGSPVQGAGRH